MAKTSVVYFEGELAEDEKADRDACRVRTHQLDLPVGRCLCFKLKCADGRKSLGEAHILGLYAFAYIRALYAFAYEPEESG